MSFPANWSRRTWALLDRCGLPIEVVERKIPGSEFGSSPGDIYWTGRKLVAERTCPEAWVIHEVAHWAVTKAEAPQYLGLKNWGLDNDKRPKEHDTDWEFWMEGEASNITVLILARLGLPWVSVMYELNIEFTEYDSRNNPVKTKSDKLRALAAIRRESGRYMAQIPS